MTDETKLIEDAARRHGLSAGAVRALWAALVAGGGRQAQFSHPELGGMGQWSGGMLQIGDMFNGALKAKVAAVCAELAEAAAAARPASAIDAGRFADRWWPAELGEPSSTGVQNDRRYAVFPAARRLAVVEGNRVTLYDTGDHRISGAGQQQGTGSALSFSSASGPVMLDALRVVGSQEIGGG